MSVRRQLTRGLRILTKRGAPDADFADEIAHFYEEAASEYRARGLSEEEAARHARVEMGYPAAIRDQVRQGGWEHIVETVVADTRLGARQLLRARGLTATRAVSMAGSARNASTTDE